MTASHPSCRSASLCLTILSFTSLFLAGTATGAYWAQRQQHRHTNDRPLNENNQEQEEESSSCSSSEQHRMAVDDKEEEPVHSVIHHFASLQLDPDASVEEANKKRTASYCLKAQQAVARQIVPGVPCYAQLMELRQAHVDRNLKYSRMGTHSHRTVVAMCDASTAALLDQARATILAPLQYSHDMSTRNVWIPDLDVIPPEDMHLTVAIPWWWHSMRPGNHQLSVELAARFRQTLWMNFHHAFQVELQQIVLLGGQTLVALWRCVGERQTEEGHVVYDRHGACVDPFVRLRVEIVRCFTQQSVNQRLQPLTYQDVVKQQQQQGETTTQRPRAGRPTLTREHSIELKTPGLGSGDGFIHTTLCRLPLDCLGEDDVSLERVHKLCRELTHTLSGHRMVISKFRFLETVGRGGLSNPCKQPIYDETIEAPSRFKVKPCGRVNEVANLHVLPQVVENSRSIGAIRKNRAAPPSVQGLFDRPMSDASLSSANSSSGTLDCDHQEAEGIEKENDYINDELNAVTTRLLEKLLEKQDDKILMKQELVLNNKQGDSVPMQAVSIAATISI